MRWKHAAFGIVTAVALMSAPQPRAAMGRINAPDAISTAQITVNAILLGPEFPIFYSGFEY